MHNFIKEILRLIKIQAEYLMMKVYHSQVKIFLYQTMFIPILLRVIKRSEPGVEQLQGKQETQPLWGILWEQG